MGALLADLHDESQASDRRYLSEDSMALLYPERDTITTAHSRQLTPRLDPESPPNRGILRSLGLDLR